MTITLADPTAERNDGRDNRLLVRYEHLVVGPEFELQPMCALSGGESYAELLPAEAARVGQLARRWYTRVHHTPLAPEAAGIKPRTCAEPDATIAREC